MLVVSYTVGWANGPPIPRESDQSLNAGWSDEDLRELQWNAHPDRLLVQQEAERLDQFTHGWGLRVYQRGLPTTATSMVLS